MIGHVYLTEQEAAKAIAILDEARGRTETLRGPDRRDYEAPTKTWAFPVPLRDGTWCVPWKRRLDPLEAKPVVVEGRPEAVPLIRDARDVTDLRTLAAGPPKDEPVKVR